MGYKEIDLELSWDVLLEYLEGLGFEGPCAPGLAYLEECAACDWTLREAWERCPHPDWMLWIAHDPLGGNNYGPPDHPCYTREWEDWRERAYRLALFAVAGEDTVTATAETRQRAGEICDRVERKRILRHLPWEELEPRILAWVRQG